MSAAYRADHWSQRPGTFQQSKIQKYIRDALGKERPREEDPRTHVFFVCRFLKTPFALYVSAYHDQIYLVKLEDMGLVPHTREPELVARYRLSSVMLAESRVSNGFKKCRRRKRLRALKRLFRRLEEDGAMRAKKMRDRGGPPELGASAALAYLFSSSAFVLMQAMDLWVGDLAARVDVAVAASAP